MALARAATILAGGLLLIWPAVFNAYPIVFSDTGGLLAMGHEPEIGWDKPWVYGPFLRATDLGRTLWLSVLAQGLLVSHTLWLVQKAMIGVVVWRHLALCAVLAAATAAPWFAALLMPDIFAPITVMALALLALAPAGSLGRGERAWLMALATFAVAVHLAHLIVAAGCLAVVLLLRWRRLPLAATPLALALLWLLATNWVGNGVLGVSPYGSIFALARLQADGPAALYIHDACPQAGYRVCAWADRLPEDSDVFLWDPDGPMWAHDFGPTMFVAEAKVIVAASLRAYPGLAFRAALSNTLEQVPMVAVGDTLIPDHLDSTVLPRLQAYFPSAEAERFAAGLQAQGALPAAAAPLVRPQQPLLVVALLGTLAVAAAGRRVMPGLAAFALVILAGLLANAAATGALSHPHDRYEARIAWLLFLPPLLALASLGKRR